MDAFARVRTKSLLLRLWPTKSLHKSVKEPMDHLNETAGLNNDQIKQNQNFLDAIKNGGIWFS
ncbi:hypothetical protein [Prochlorococcus marinus]|uniref:hypothetical protein n=1 Tax=Prochlorococcus marinus TaxID=1219 RepID=UPI0022B51CE5|nr:hypothetical protein [Prochlorococcus marinus]